MRCSRHSSHISAVTSGFTLVELLVVVLVVGILATIGVVSYRGIHIKAADDATRANVHRSQTALESGYAASRLYPTTLSAPSVSGLQYVYAAGNDYRGQSHFCLAGYTQRYSIVYWVRDGGEVTKVSPLTVSTICQFDYYTSATVKVTETIQITNLSPLTLQRVTL